MDAVPTLITTKGDSVAVTDGSFVTAFYFLLERVKRGQWLVIRPGTGGVLLTTDVGVQALLRFRRGATVDDVSAEIAKIFRLPRQQVSLASLLSAAGGEGLIKSVDGCRIKAPRAHARAWIRHFLKKTVYPVLFALASYCPLRQRERLLSWLQWRWEGRFTHYMERDRVASNLRRLFPAMPEETVKSKTEAFHRHLVRSNLGAIATRSGLRRALMWAETFIAPEAIGAERLRRCIDRGSGALVVTFHFGGFWLIPVTLLRMGVHVHVVMASISDAERSATEECARAGLEGSIHFYDRTVVSLAALCRAAGRGDVVVIFADNHDLHRSPRLRMVHDAWPLPAAEGTTSTLLGHPFRLDGTVEWLRRESGAPVIPAVLRPSTSNPSRLQLEFGPIVEGEAEDVGTTTQILRQWERWLTEAPELWHRLRLFPVSAS